MPVVETEYQTGVQIEYREGLGVFTGTPYLTRLEPAYNFNTGLGLNIAPWNAVGIFSARAIGYVQAPVTGLRHFFFFKNGGHRVLINDEIVDEQFFGGDYISFPDAWHFTYPMVAGQIYKFEILYSNGDSGNAKTAQMLWGDNAGYHSPSTVVMPFKYTTLKEWNDMYLIFNDSIIQESSGSPRWSTIRLADEVSEVRKPFRSIPLWTIDLSGLLMTPHQYEELLAFQYQIEGMLNPFLIRNVRNCLFENFRGEGQLLGEGTADETTTFQLIKTRPIQGRTSTEIIRYPNWEYPDLLDINDNVWAILPELQLYAGGTPTVKGDLIPTLDMVVDRNTGLVTVPVEEGVPVYAYGGFFTKVIANEDEIPVKPDRNMFRVSKGVTFSQPVGGDVNAD